MKTAVFYDLENIGLTNGNGGFENTFCALLQKIKASALVSEIVLQRAYISKSNPHCERLSAALAKHKVELVAVESLDPLHKKANMVDFKMNVDVIAAIASKRSVKTVVVTSGDQDFGFMCQQIKNMGRNLLVVSRFNTTSAAMLKLCDDWIDLSKSALPPKWIRDRIDARIVTADSGAGFFPALLDFLGAMEHDALIRRVMTSAGLPISLFTQMVYDRIPSFPKNKPFGFSSIASYLEMILGGTNFAFERGNVVYIGHERQAFSQERLIESILSLPSGYSREKLDRYYASLYSARNVEEMLAYVQFLQRNGLLRGNALCARDMFCDVIDRRVRYIMAQAGIPLDPGALRSITDKLGGTADNPECADTI